MCQSKRKARNRSPGLKYIFKIKKKEVNCHNLIKNETNKNIKIIISYLKK